MREIRFRVWDEKESCMITSPQSVADLIGKAIVGTLEKDRYVFMQHTGMKLANGQEVYEGDIVKVSWLAELGVTELDCEAIGVIEYTQARFRIRLVPPFKTGVYCGADCPGTYEEEFLDLYQPQSWDEGYCVERIGNIHDNPELVVTDDA